MMEVLVLWLVFGALVGACEIVALHWKISQKVEEERSQRRMHVDALYVAVSDHKKRIELLEK